MFERSFRHNRNPDAPTDLPPTRHKENADAITLNTRTTTFSVNQATQRMAKRVCRITIVGAQRARVRKAVSLLLENNDDTTVNNSDDVIINVEYLPCVATFGSYENEQGERIRYLAKVEYHGAEGSDIRGSSLAPFFDNDNEQRANDKESTLPTFPGISAVAIGCGIESKQDVAMIETFVKSLAGQTNNDEQHSSIVVKCVSPNADYTCMKQENAAYKALSVEDKEEVTRLQTMGPGKMSKFASSLAKSVVEDALQQSQQTNEETTIAPKDMNHSTTEAPNDVHAGDVQEPLIINPNKTRYACRTCRTILFGQDQLEDPPHVPMMHTFRKSHHGTPPSNNASCSSLFLKEGLNWMGNISTAGEGKFSCPKCHTKLGHWKWAGAQCSCGTWVTPAIQVPISKVDNVNPYCSELNSAAVAANPTIAKCQDASLE